MKRSLSKCTLGQASLLAQLAEKTFRESFEEMNDPEHFEDYIQKAFNLEQVRRELSAKDSEFHLLYQDEHLVGYYKTNVHQAQTDIKETDGMELERIYVLSEFQGNGHGRYMIEHAKKHAQAQNKAYLWLGVWKKNKDAVRFYQDNGFSIFGEHPYYIGSDRQMDWLMLYDLITLLKNWKST